MKSNYLCPRCRCYSCSKDALATVGLAFLDLVLFAIAVVTGSGFVVIALLIMLPITVVVCVGEIVSIALKKCKFRYTCKNCGSTWTDDQINKFI